MTIQNCDFHFIAEPNGTSRRRQSIVLIVIAFPEYLMFTMYTIGNVMDGGVGDAARCHDFYFMVWSAHDCIIFMQF